jgi:hypothetical protein
MLTNPRGSGFFAGNYELLGEIFWRRHFSGRGQCRSRRDHHLP